MITLKKRQLNMKSLGNFSLQAQLVLKDLLGADDYFIPASLTHMKREFLNELMDAGFILEVIHNGVEGTRLSNLGKKAVGLLDTIPITRLNFSSAGLDDEN